MLYGTLWWSAVWNPLLWSNNNNSTTNSAHSSRVLVHTFEPLSSNSNLPIPILFLSLQLRRRRRRRLSTFEPFGWGRFLLLLLGAVLCGCCCCSSFLATRSCSPKRGQVLNFLQISPWLELKPVACKQEADARGRLKANSHLVSNILVRIQD